MTFIYKPENHDHDVGFLNLSIVKIVELATSGVKARTFFHLRRHCQQPEFLLALNATQARFPTLRLV